MSESEHSLQRRRAEVFARSNLYFNLFLLLIVGMGDVIVSASWFYFMLIATAIAAFALYLIALRSVQVTRATLGLFLILELLVAAAVYRGGGVLSSTVTFFSALIVGVGLVLTTARTIVFVTLISLLVYTTLMLLEFFGLLHPPMPGPLLAEQPLIYKVYAAALQLALIGLVGAVTAAMVRLMQQRAAALEQARADASEHAQEAEHLAAELNAKVEALRATEEALRGTVDQLSVPALPLREGAMIIPLIGTVDGTRAQRLTRSLLETIYEREVQLVILDLTGIEQVTEGLPAMLTRMTRGARLLGAELVVAGLQPAMARMLTTQAGGRIALHTFQTLEQAIDYAFGRRELV